MKIQVRMTLLDVPLHIKIMRNKSLVVSIIKEIANYGLLVVASYIHVGSAMIMLVTILWTGEIFHQ